MNRELIDKIKELIQPFLKQMELELFEITCKPQGKRMLLRILVDRREGGISLEDCAALNQSLGELLDREDFIESNYLLEVSSPGIDRPLKQARDFLRIRGKKARFFLSEQIIGRQELVGRIDSCDEKGVSVHIDGERIDIPLDKIIKAKQIIGEW